MKLDFSKVRDVKLGSCEDNEDKYTQAQKDAMKRDLMFLLGRCDGALSRDDVGFNAYDTETARRMAYELDVGRSINWVHLARVLRKYRKTQLGGHDDY